MPLLKKMSVGAVVMTMALKALAATDWSEVIKAAPFSKNVTLTYDEKGYVELKAIQLPNGHFRLTDFSNYQASKKPRVYVDLPNGLTDVEKQCQISAKDKKPFKAFLKLTVNPMLQPGSLYPNMKMTLQGQTSTLSNVQFENPYTLGTVKVDFSAVNMTYSRIPHVPEYEQLGWMVKDYFVKLLNSQAQATGTADVTIDLSDMNGFACDLMLGKIQLKVTQTATYSPGAAERYVWMDSDEYVKVFKSYWQGETLFFGENSSAVTKEDRAFLLGYQSSPLNFETVSISTIRLQSLIHSLTFNVTSLSSQQKDQLSADDLKINRTLTDTFTIPNGADRDTVRELIISDVETFTAPLSEMK